MSQLAPVLDRIPANQLRVFGEAVDDLFRYNLTQPTHGDASPEGVKARVRQWGEISGRRQTVRARLLGIAAIVAGAVAGFVLGIPLTQESVPDIFQPSVFGAALGAGGGWFLGRFIRQSSGYHDGMMQVFVNERLTPIPRGEMVTAQAELWVPKALLAWRAHVWRYSNGRPYMWLRLPFGVRLLEAVEGTLSVLTLANDEYRAMDAAVYSQRSVNRMISDSGLDFAEIDNPGEEGNPMIELLLPYVPAVIMVGIGMLVVMMNA